MLSKKTEIIKATIGEDKKIVFKKSLNQPALVCAGPCNAFTEKSLKYLGIDNPKKRDTPVMKRFLKEFMFVNCRKDSPTEAVTKK